jgi:hypothetical protein
MTPEPILRLVLLVALLAILPFGAANAAQSLAAAIKSADAKYLQAPDVEGEDKAPKIEAGTGEENASPTPQEISQGSIRAALSYAEEKSEDEEVTRTPTVTIFADGKEVAKLDGDGGGLADPPVSVQIAEIDPGNPHPEVVVSFFTGGAHCCSDTSVIESNKDGSKWQTVEIGEFDGGPLLATDVNNDGRYEFETRDNAFLYAFGCYACSTAPLELLTVENGEVKNITGDEAFRPAHAAYLKHMIEEVPDEDVNGFLAGYVGEKILLGEGKQAWDIMLRYYDKTSDWGLDSCDKPVDENGECPGQEIKLTYPQALERMLKESGYKVEK